MNWQFPVHITGNRATISMLLKQAKKYNQNRRKLYSLQDRYRVELLHREIPVISTGNGFAVWFKSPKRRIFARICAGSSVTWAGRRRQHRRRQHPQRRRWHRCRHRGQAMHYSCFKSLALCEDLLFNGPNAHESQFRLHHGLRIYDV